MVFGWELQLFSWEEKWNDEKCNLYKFTLMLILGNFLIYILLKNCIWMDTSYIKNNYKNPKEVREKNKWFDGEKNWRRSNIKWQKQKKKKKWVKKKR